MQITPKPWKIGKPKIGTSIPIYGPPRIFIPKRSKKPRSKIFNVAHVSNSTTFLEGSANAALIAAAPDLYDVAVAALSYLCDSERSADDLLPLIEQLETIIKKAKGV